MIAKCKIESWKFIDGSYAMQNNNHLIQWDSDLNLLKNGKSMFLGCSNLNSFDAAMDSLISGNAMFWGCYNLNSFTSNLSSLSDGSYMFHLSGITSFNQSMNNLVNGDCMFYGSSIASFDGSLNSLRNGSKMFAVTPLQNVSSYLMLGSLITGDNMFLYVAGLDIQSTNNILNALPDYKNNPIMTWNQSTNTYSEWNKIDTVIYPITQLAGGVDDEIGSTYLTPGQINTERVATITITFADDYISSLSSE